MTLGREDYIEMLTYARPEGSVAQKQFCDRYLKPIMGKPDKHGNYTKIVGKNPTVAFMSHHDTVHSVEGRVSVSYHTTRDGSFARAVGGSCLGADCTTGVYLMLKMIEASVPGVYVIHAGEEMGCIGSSALVRDYPDWIKHVDFAISFDRMGYNSIITHQMGQRCCSDAFVDSFNEILGSGYFGDSSGIYTDSNKYVGVISECTNLSVGYFSQHTKNEHQDLVFLDDLVTALVNADWSKLVSKRVPVEVTTFDRFEEIWGSNYGYKDDGDNCIDRLEKFDIAIVISKYPEEVAEILMSFGYSSDGLQDDCDDIAIKNRKSYGRVF